MRLIHDLLDTCQDSENESQLAFKPIDLGEVLTNTFKAVANLMKAKGQTCCWRLPSNRAIVIKGDLIRLTQIFTNLLTNAVKYTPEHGHIEVLVNEDPNQIHVIVKDNGIGISPIVMPHIFDLFFRGADENEATVKGLGIGLTLVKKWVEQHKGSISVVSEGLNQGSAFTVTLPLANGR
jgi:signal transduction histidine kinase